MERKRKMSESQRRRKRRNNKGKKYWHMEKVNLGNYSGTRHLREHSRISCFPPLRLYFMFVYIDFDIKLRKNI